MRKLLTAALAGGLLAAVMVPAQAAPVTVFTDASGDATIGGQSPQSLPGGWDITEGQIERKGANLEFTVTHADMPPTGSAPEGTRFIWNFMVGKTPYRLTVKSVDIGKPDAATQTGQERIGRVDINGHFRLEGECATDNTLPVGFVNCPVIGY